MLKQYPAPASKTRRGGGVYIYPLRSHSMDDRGMRSASTSTYWKSPYYGSDFRQLNIEFKNTELYNTTIRKKMEEKEKAVKSILKNGGSRPSSERSPTEMSKGSERGKTKYSLKQTNSISESGSQYKKEEKKVKFDDKYVRLNAIETKYRISHERPSNTTNKKHQENNEECSVESDNVAIFKGISKVSLCPDTATHTAESTRSSANGISNCSVDPEVDVSNKDLQLKTVLYGKVSRENVDENRVFDKRTDDYDEEGSDYSLIEENVILNYEETENVPCHPHFIDCQRRLESDKTVNEHNNDSNKRMKVLLKSRTSPNLMVTRHSHSLHDVRVKRGSLDDSHINSKISLGRRRISGKTTVNTIGGAIVTRSHVRPVMFSRVHRDPLPMSNDIRPSYKNFCDKNKTSQIVNWLEQVKKVHAREGPCIQAESEIDMERFPQKGS